MNDKEQRPAKWATATEDPDGDASSLRSTLLAALHGSRHLGDISESLERIARALEKMAARAP